MCSSYRSNKNPQTVKLSPRSSVHHLSATSLPGRYENVLTPMRPNRPHIPSTYTTSKSADTKQTTHPNFGRICRRASRFSVRRSDSPLPIQPVPRSRVSSASVRRCLGPPATARKRENRILSHFLRNCRFFHKFRGLSEVSHPLPPWPRKILAANPADQATNARAEPRFQTRAPIKTTMIVR